MNDKQMPTPSELKQFAAKIYKGNAENGFWDEPRSTNHLVILMKSEVFEALECWRNRQDIDKDSFDYFCQMLDWSERKGYERFCDIAKDTFKNFYKETKEVEIADTIIRVLDTMAHFEIPFLELKRVLVSEDAGLALYVSLDKRLHNLYDKDFDKELAQEFANILSILFSYDDNMMQYARVKALYNTTREKMHGNKRA